MNKTSGTDKKKKQTQADEVAGLLQKVAELEAELENCRVDSLNNETRFFELLDSLPLFAYLQRPDHTIRYANKFFRNIYGEPGDRPCYEVIWERKEPCEPCPTFRVFETNKTEVWESSHPDGSSFRVYDIPFTDTDGTPLVLEVSLDRTDVKRAADELKTCDIRYKMLVETIPYGIQEIDTSGIITFCNRACSKLLGYTPEELVGKSIFSMIPDEEEREKLRSYLNYLAADEPPPTPYFVVNITRSGDIIDIQIDWNYKHDKEGRLTGFVSIITDITERTEAKKEKERLRAQLIQAQRMEAIGTLAGGIAHDFNNIMTVIKSLTALAMNKMDQTDEDCPFSHYLKPIREVSERGINLVQQLLIFSKNKPVELSYLNMNDVIDDFLKIIGTLISEDITIKKKLEQGLWDIKADKGRIEQVLTNLVINSRDSLLMGGTITLRTENITLTADKAASMQGASAGNFICLTVQDNGKGMEQEVLEHVFEPFFTTKAPQGSGLGLSVVYGIVKEMGGWINVTSEAGRGTRFMVYLPISTGPGEAAPKKSVRKKAFNGDGRRILLVEDDKWVRKSIAMVLTENGYAVFEAPSAEQAISLFYKEKGRFDLVMSDVVMPGKTGLQLVSPLLDINPNTPILLCSGHLDDKAQLEQIIKRGIPYIQKPFEIEDLLQAIEDIIEENS